MSECHVFLPRATRAPLRPQISLSNPLTIPVSFRVETHGPFAINPAPSKNRLQNGRNSSQERRSGGRSSSSGGCGDDGGDDEEPKDGHGQPQPLGFLGQEGYSQKRRQTAAGVGGGGIAPETAATAGTVRGEEDPKSVAVEAAKQRHHHQQKREQVVVLLPGQNLQLELVFLPSRGTPEMSQALQSSFSPGTEVFVIFFFILHTAVGGETNDYSCRWFVE